MVVFSQDSSNVVTQFLQNTKLSGQWFLAGTYDKQDDLNQFQLKRGYFTLKTDLSKKISVRYTQDITLDEEGSDTGNVEIRMKYLYLKLELNDFIIFNDNYFEFGLVHRPWLDYEEHINTYRVQEKMFIERFGIMNSADFGITFVSLLGGKLDAQYQHRVNHTYPGKYGSFAVGVYNGGGYHALEENNNKTIEARLSLRPLPSKMPGLQITYNMAYGKANTANMKSDFQHNMFFISSESKYHVATAQYIFGKGDSGTKYIDTDGESFKNKGYSFFGEAKIPKTKFALFCRYDNFTVEEEEDITNQAILGGLAYRFLKNKVILDFNHLDHDGEKHQKYEIALEVKF
jgi:hypothetical protein